MAVPIINKYSFNESTLDQQLFGHLQHRSSSPPAREPEPLLARHQQCGRPFNGTSGREQRQTSGGRTSGKIGQTNLDFEVEGAGKF